MRRVSLGLAFVAGLLVSGVANAAPGTASSFWNDPYHRTTDQQAIDLAMAEAQQRARNGGYGPGDTNIGTYNSTSNYNGPTTQNSSGSTNVVNSNSSTVSTTNSSGLSVTITTGQMAGPANQQAGSQANSTGGNAVIGGIDQGPHS